MPRQEQSILSRPVLRPAQTHPPAHRGRLPDIAKEALTHGGFQREDDMAHTTSPATDAKPTIGVLQVTFTVEFVLNDTVQSPLAIRQEARTWLENLGAAVQSITIHTPA
jgi:hypothetical protein